MRGPGTILLVFAAGVTGLILSSFGGGDSDYGQGSPGGYSGSPADGKTCILCHGGSATPVSGWINSDVPVTGYVPGSTYTITVSVHGTGDKGFEVSPQSVTGALLGSLTAGTGMHPVNMNKALTQNSSSFADPSVWTFTWTAPAAGTGPVTFYGAFTVNKPVTKTSVLVIPEAVTGMEEPAVYSLHAAPNPCRDGFVLSYSLNAPMQVNACLLDLSGKKVLGIADGKMDAGNHLHRVSLPGLRGGVYLLRVTTGERIHSRKLLIRH